MSMIVRDATVDALLGRTRASVLGVLFLSDAPSMYVREIIRATGGSPGAVQRALKDLEAMGLLIREEHGNQVHYRPNTNYSAYEDLRGLLQKSAGDGPNIEDPELREAVDRLVEALHPERVYLFGSKARNEEADRSDYDLLVIVPDSSPPEAQDRRQIHDILWDVGISADVVIWTSSAFDRRARVPASLPATVMREGRLLYAA